MALGIWNVRWDSTEAAVQWDAAVGTWGDSGWYLSGTVTLTGHAPNLPVLKYIPTADLTLFPYAPLAIENKTITVTKGDITLTAYIPSALEGSIAKPGKADLTLTGSSPTIGQTFSFNIGGDLTLIKTIPDVQHRAPLYKAEVNIF
tara:strand:- start:249 stop:686 length:438 start_codon:yes stop_codon:yes gene_type:complete